MKKLFRPLFVFVFPILMLTVLLMAGCSTEKYYDASNQPATYNSPHDSSSQQAAQAALADFIPQTGSGSSSPAPTVLREGDTVKISFPGAQNLDETEQIRLDGKISLPLV